MDRLEIHQRSPVRSSVWISLSSWSGWDGVQRPRSWKWIDENMPLMKESPEQTWFEKQFEKGRVGKVLNENQPTEIFHRTITWMADDSRFLLATRGWIALTFAAHTLHIDVSSRTAPQSTFYSLYESVFTKIKAFTPKFKRCMTWGKEVAQRSWNRAD